MMKTCSRSIIATVLISAMLASCATQNGQGSLSQGNNPCQPAGTQYTDSPTASFVKQALLNPLANMGGTLLATAAANYSQHYTGKLNTLLTNLVTPKQKNKKKGSDQDFVDFEFQPGQPDDHPGFPPEDPNTGFPVGDQHEFDPEQFSEYPNTGFDEIHPFESGAPQEAFDPDFQGEIYPRGVPGQFPHATFPSTPCDQQMNPQAYPVDYPHNQPYDHDPYDQQPYPSDSYAEGYPPQDPYAQQPYPQDAYAQAEMEAGLSIQKTETPIGLDVVMVKQTIRNGAQAVLPIQDGEVLRDGRGNAAAGDKFRIMFRPNTDGHVYVIAIDGSGWAQGIFPPPTSPLANPVKAGEQYVLPGGTNWFSLDQFKGIETIFFVASHDKRQDIEDILQSITGHERPASESPRQVTKVAMVPYGVGRSRPSANPFSLSGGSGQDHTIIPTSYLAQQAGQDLRLTRWFRHE